MYKVRITIRKPKKQGKEIVSFIKSLTVDDFNKLNGNAKTIFDTIEKNKPVLNSFFEKDYQTIEFNIEEGYWLYKNFGKRSKIYAFFLALWLANKV